MFVVNKENCVEAFEKTMGWLKNPDNPAYGWVTIEKEPRLAEDQYLYTNILLPLVEEWVKGDKAMVNRYIAFPSIVNNLNKLFHVVDWINDNEDSLSKEDKQRLFEALR